MKIRHQLFLSSIIIITITVLMASSFIINKRIMSSIQEEHNVSMILKTDISELNILATDYILYQEDRVLSQLSLKIQKIETSLNSNPAIQEVLEEGFETYQTNFDKIRTLTLIEEKSELQEQRENRATSQLLITSHSLISKISKVVEETEDKKRAFAQRQTLITGSLIIVLFLIATMLSFILNQSVLKPLSSLTLGAQKIGKGDFTYKIPVKTNNEVGILAQNINKMSGELNTMYSSLEKKIKERTKDLKKAYEVNLKKEKDIQDMKDQVLFIVAHDLRTPITALNWSMEILDDDTCKPISKEQKEMVEIAKQNIITLSNLVNNLLEVSKLGSETYKVKKEKLNCYSVVNAITKSMQLLIEKKRINLTIEGSDKDVPNIYSDSKRLSEILSNLISNTIKYTPEKGRVNISFIIKKEELIIAIKDSGIGLSKEDIKKIFNKFVRIERKISKKEPGTGLGLFIAAQIAEQLNGRTWAESEGRDKGSTFYLALPIES